MHYYNGSIIGGFGYQQPAGYVYVIAEDLVLSCEEWVLTELKTLVLQSISHSQRRGPYSQSSLMHN